MPLFIVQWKDKVPEGADIRAATRAEHLAWVANQPIKIKLGGPFLNADDGMAGSLMIIEAEDLAAAEAFHAADPYTRAGLFESSRVDPWRITLPWKE